MNTNLAIKNSIPFLDLASKFFDDDFNYFPFFENNQSRILSNVKETNDEYLIELSTPGYKKDDIKIEIENGVLIISSSIENNNEEKNNGYYKKEFYKSSFEKKYVIPKNSDKNKISANMENGILEIKIPKFIEENKKETIQISIK